MDSLRYWVTEMHVDGFRFDLAATLARQFHDVDRLSAFFDLVQQDPVVSQVKLIAEPWDVGDGGYQVGNFPPLWSEWNGKYRDAVRDFWRGQPATLAELASRLTGSRPLRQRRPPADRQHQLRHLPRRLHPGRPGQLRPQAQRGQRRGQPRRHRRQPVLELRRRGTDRRPGSSPAPRQQRNLLATLLLSQGVPMLLGGDELGRTQHGNNNAYCQDNELSWVHWGRRSIRSDFTRSADQAAGRAPGVQAAAVLHRRGGPGYAGPPRRHRLADTGRSGDDGR
jgi:isoamylase